MDEVRGGTVSGAGRGARKDAWERTNSNERRGRRRSLRRNPSRDSLGERHGDYLVKVANGISATMTAVVPKAGLSWPRSASGWGDGQEWQRV